MVFIPAHFSMPTTVTLRPPASASPPGPPWRTVEASASTALLAAADRSELGARALSFAAGLSGCLHLLLTTCCMHQLHPQRWWDRPWRVIAPFQPSSQRGAGRHQSQAALAEALVAVLRDHQPA